MSSDNLSTGHTLAEARLLAQGSAIEACTRDASYRQLIILIFALNVISAVLFMLLVDRPVYDDQYNIFDVHTYAANGVSVATIRSNRNPPGPSSFLWMAAAVRLLGGEELLDARIAVLLSWALLFVGIFVGARYSSFPQLWYGALLASLVFPHSVTATATVLTEGPALLFAILGVLAWIESTSRPIVSPATCVVGIIGGLLMGIAVTCRQYYLALLPAAALLALYQSRRRDSREKSLWLVGVILSLTVAVVPVLLLILIWKGLSSPGMATGTSYEMWKAGVGLNLSRPIVAIFYIAFYLIPLTFPVMVRLQSALRWRAILVASLGGIPGGYFRSSLLQPGPLHTLVRSVSRVPAGEFVFFGFIAAVTIYNAIALGLLLWEQQAIVLSRPPMAFALLTVTFFIVEQFGVGGNIPLYDRYLLQLAPFFGLIAFSLLPRLTHARLLALAALSAVSQVMLWRYAFDTRGF